MDSKQKITLMIGVAAIVLIVAIVLLFNREPAPAGVDATQATANSMIAVPPAAFTKTEDEYSGQCTTENGGLLFGTVVDNDGKDPKTLKTVTLRNNNTGKTTKFDVAKDYCTFSQ